MKIIDDKIIEIEGREVGLYERLDSGRYLIQIYESGITASAPSKEDAIFSIVQHYYYSHKGVSYFAC